MKWCCNCAFLLPFGPKKQSFPQKNIPLGDKVRCQSLESACHRVNLVESNRLSMLSVSLYLKSRKREKFWQENTNENFESQNVGSFLHVLPKWQERPLNMLNSPLPTVSSSISGQAGSTGNMSPRCATFTSTFGSVMFKPTFQHNSTFCSHIGSCMYSFVAVEPHTRFLDPKKQILSSCGGCHDTGACDVQQRTLSGNGVMVR